MKQYRHINQQEREMVFLYHNQGKSNREIGTLLGRDHRSIGRELKRNSTSVSKRYLPSSAHLLAGNRRKNSKKSKLDDGALRSYVIKKLGCQWSPEQIAGRIKLTAPASAVSYETIYSFIYHPDNKKLKLWEFLRHRHSRRECSQGRRTKKLRQIPHRVFIKERPLEANLRLTIGHWETDLMEGRRTTGAHVSVLSDRKSLLVKLSKVASKKPEEKHASIIKQFKREDAPFVKTITMDNGSENFHHYKVAEELLCKTYFCNPYHAWEKGTVENIIGLVRQYFPKGADLRAVREEELVQIAHELNTRPRKKLGFYTPLEVFTREAKWGTSF